jgi:hypothetical protein
MIVSPSWLLGLGNVKNRGCRYMQLQMKRVREIVTGLTLLGQEPIESHLLNFRLKVAVTLLSPFLKTLQDSEEAILIEHCEKDTETRAPRDEHGVPKWLSRESEDVAVMAMKEILDSQVEVPGLASLTWSQLEAAKCAYTDRERGVRQREPLVVSLQVQMLLGDFIEGNPSEEVKC